MIVEIKNMIKKILQIDKKVVIGITSILIALLILLFGNNWIGRCLNPSTIEKTEVIQEESSKIKIEEESNLVYTTKRINYIKFPDFVFSHELLTIKNETNRAIKNINGSFEKGGSAVSLSKVVLRENNNIAVELSFDEKKAEFQIQDLNPNESISFDILVDWDGGQILNMSDMVNYSDLRGGKNHSLDKIKVRGEGFTGVLK